MNTKTLLILILVILGIGAIFFLQNKSGSDRIDDNGPAMSLEEAGDPRDAASEFYADWRNAILSSTTDPFTEGLATDIRLSADVQAYLAENREGTSNGLEPVLCQPETPPKIGFKEVFWVEDEAQFLMFPGGTGPKPDRAVIDLKVGSTGWVIEKIECVTGESAPVGEFAFDRSGFLLKNDQPPLQAGIWYLVFEENGEDGHFAPLTFSADSMCIIDAEETVCDPESFENPTEATVKGGMTEAGVEVVRVEF